MFVKMVARAPETTKKFVWATRYACSGCPGQLPFPRVQRADRRIRRCGSSRLRISVFKSNFAGLRNSASFLSVASPALLSWGTADLNFRHVPMGIRSRDTIWSKPQATKISVIFDNANYGQNILRTRIETR